MRLSLNGYWNFNQVGTSEVMPAEIPSLNYLDLMKNGKMEDPFVGTNEKDVYWIAEKDWEYFRAFEIGQELMDCDKVILCATQLDTLAEITINNKHLAHTKNAHISYEFDIKNYLVIGENQINIVFKSPVNYVKQKQKEKKCPFNANGQNGIPHIRKAQSNFGWDWGPVLPASGICGDIYIEGRNTAQIESVKWTQSHQNNVVELTLWADVQNYFNKELNYKIKIVTPSEETIEQKGSFRSKVFETLTIKNPELWWTYELNKKKTQALYSCTVSIYDGNILLSEDTKLIGLRTISLNRNLDKYGSNFQFILNGVPIFAKGANWIPIDSFRSRATISDYEFYVDSCIQSNFNMLRIWGGGYYEDDLFDLCDKRGILLWQDFAFACQAYPFFDKDFLDNMYDEVTFITKKLLNHPSLVVWCGNNEIESASNAWLHATKFVKWTNTFFYDILPSWIREIDSQTAYIPGSPCGASHRVGTQSDNVGDTHLWAVWHGLQPLDYYRNRYTRFCSEFGFESLPDLKTIETFAEKKDYSLSSEVFNSHQKCMSGNRRIAYYIASRFRLPKKFEDYIYLSQICQLECVKDATEHWRRHTGRCNGSLYWQLNDCWNVCSWSSIDYQKNYKALQYGAKHFFNPLTISIHNTEKYFDIYVINDTLFTKGLVVGYKIVTFEGKMICNDSCEITCEQLSNAQHFSVDIEKLNLSKSFLSNCVFYAYLKEDKNIISERTMLFEKEKNIIFPDATITIEYAIKKDMGYIKIQSDAFCRFTAIYSTCNKNPFSDNYFDLLANQPKTISIKLDRAMTIDEFSESITLTSLKDVVPNSNKIFDNFKRLHVLLEPINFVSYLYMHKTPKNISMKYIKKMQMKGSFDK